MKIYVFGNILVDIDSLPIKLIPLLRKEFPEIEFCELDPSEDFPKEKILNIIDTVLGITKVEVFKDIEKFKLGNLCSLHDFDLGFNLRLMKKFKMIEKVNIIGVPPNIKPHDVINQIKELKPVNL
jgi:hypothetical protein